ncbi:MAG: hypothetical protein QMD01_04325 [Thermodesulfovibrionales bacterium]|nr:hypothetical protein [Thermodesulfovibrionales bacterium]
MAQRMAIDFFSISPLTGLKGFVISPGKGFFYYSPIAIFFFFSLKSFIKKHVSVALCFVWIIISYLLFFSRYIYWHGDLAWGPRYLLVITPFLIIPVVQLFDPNIWNRKKLLKATIYFIFIISFAIQFIAVSVHFNKYFIHQQFEKRVEFSIASCEGVQPIVSPPAKTYFEWKKSPILAQFGFILEIAGKIKDYKYLKPPDDVPVVEKIKAQPYYNVFDFWWMYKYFLGGSYSGFTAAFGLFLISIYSAVRLWKVAK